MGRIGLRTLTAALFVALLSSTASRAGNIDESQEETNFSFPSRVGTDNAGNIYVSDSHNNTIYKVTQNAMVTTLAGTAGTRGDTDGAGAAARFIEPSGITTDRVGNVYVADSINGTIRKISPVGVVTTLVSDLGNLTSGVAIDSDSNVYVAVAGDETIRKITSAGVVTILAGKAGWSGHADGIKAAARFHYPTGVAIDSMGNLFVADSGNNTIRKITPAGVVTTLAGTAGKKGSADGTKSAARFNHPMDVAIDSTRNVYVADSGNNTVRKITPAGVVTTLAGSAGLEGDADGTGAEARFHQPNGVATDSAGNVYVADTCNHAIRKISPAGVVATLVGSNEGLSCEEAGAD